jgi:hypothetical protein
VTAPARWRLPAHHPKSEHGQQADAERAGDSRRVRALLEILAERTAAQAEAERARQAQPDLWNPPAPAPIRESAPLDTLAQLRQSDTLKKRARARYLSLPLAVTLAELRSPLEMSYRNTVYCCSELKQVDGKVTGRYCGNRWCLVCNRIRTARAIQRYLPVVDEWPDKQLVTLTVRNVPAPALAPAIAEMVSEFQAIKLGMRRTAGVKLLALRKLECTYNERTDEYHPHFHLVVQTHEQAVLLRDAWLERHPETTDAKGQDVRPCDGESLREMFKYFTKLLAKRKHVPPAALDVIFRAMKCRRVYQPAGFIVASKTPDENADIDPVEATAATSRQGETLLWEWNQGAADWVDDSTGECLTGYEPGEKFRAFVAEMVPKECCSVA